MLSLTTKLSRARAARALSYQRPFCTPYQRQLFKREAAKLLVYLTGSYQRPAAAVTVVLLEHTAITALVQQYAAPASDEYEEFTDVLTFSYTTTPTAAVEGDILLCPELIFRAAAEDKHAAAYALIETTLHGMLHLYGMRHNYHHASIAVLSSTQAAILNQINLNWKKLNALVQSV